MKRIDGIFMKKVVIGDCEICGKKATISSRLNRDSYLVAESDGKLIQYENHLYCEEHFLEILTKLWSRVKNIW